MVSAKKLLISRLFIGIHTVVWFPIGQHFVTTRVVHLPKRTEISWITEADLITELGPCIAALAGKVSFSSCRTFIRVCQLYCRLKKLQKLLHAVLNLDQSTIAEIRGYNSPPAGIHEVMKATLLVLGFWEEETHVSFENWKILSNKEYAKETKIKPNFNGSEHLWNHEKMFEIGVVRGNECEL